MSPPPRAQDILFFWFGPRPYTAARIQQHARLWFGEPDAPEITPQTDDLIRERYADLTLSAERGELSAWESSPRRRLALILLLDQFPRNIYRGTARAFAQDLQALSLAVSGMQFGADATLDPVERLFFYMPLMHAESPTSRTNRSPPSAGYSRRPPPSCTVSSTATCDMPSRTGTSSCALAAFPHRNQALGRESTPEEIAWLAAKGEDFAS
jgi:uncharacterized protein (DUF924 family)